MGVSYINLDGLYWEPGWKKLSDDDFRKKVRAAMDQSDKGWVIDGSYSRVLGTIVDDEATDVICKDSLYHLHSGTLIDTATGLDPPFALYFPRLCLRTVWRLLRLAPPCSPGCDERIREVFFSSDSIVWWCITNHRVVQKRESERYRTESIHVGGRMRRIGGWGGELPEWKESVRQMTSMD